MYVTNNLKAFFNLKSKVRRKEAVMEVSRQQDDDDNDDHRGLGPLVHQNKVHQTFDLIRPNLLVHKQVCAEI